MSELVWVGWRLVVIMLTCLLLVMTVPVCLHLWIGLWFLLNLVVIFQMAGRMGIAMEEALEV